MTNKTFKNFNEKLDKSLISIATLSGAVICILYLFISIPLGYYLYSAFNILTASICLGAFYFIKKEKTRVLFWVFFITIPILMLGYTYFFGFVNASLFVIPCGVFVTLINKKFEKATYFIWIFIALTYVVAEFFEIRNHYIELSGLEVLLRVPNTLAALFLIFFGVNHFKKKYEKQRAELLELNLVKEKLISIISHDLRAPINSLKGLLQLNKEGDISNENLKIYISTLSTEVENTSVFMDNLLYWVKDKISGANPKPVNLNLLALILENLNFLDPKTKDKNISIELNVDPMLEVVTDKEMLNVIMRNLISNALKFVEEKKGVINIDAKQIDNTIQLTISDNGIGMDQEKINQVFNGSVDSTLGTKNEKGFGLGLQLVIGYAKELNISLDIQSEPTKGTTFILTF